MLLRLGITILSVPILIGSLGLVDYGVWTVLLAVLGLVPLTQVGVAGSISFYLADVEARGSLEDRKEILGTSLLLTSVIGGTVAALICGTAPLLVDLLFADSPSHGALLVSLILFAVVSLVQSWRNWAIAVEEGFLRYDLQAWAESAGTVILYGGLMVIAWLGYGLVGLAIWLLLATLITVFAHGYFLFGTLGLRFNLYEGWCLSRARELLKFGVIHWVSLVGATLFGYADRILVNILLGPAAVGLYSVATSIAVRIAEISGVPIRTITPAISSAKAGGNVERIRDLFVRAQKLSIWVIYLVVATVLVGAQPISVLLVTPEHATQLAPLLRILALVYALTSLNGAGFYAAIGIGRPAINARWIPSAGLLFSLLLLVLVPRYGLIGAAWANLGYILTLAIIIEVIREIGIRLRTYVRSLLPFLCSVLLCWFITAVSLSSSRPLWLQIVMSIGLIVIPLAWIGGNDLRSSILILLNRERKPLFLNRVRYANTGQRRGESK